MQEGALAATYPPDHRYLLVIVEVEADPIKDWLPCLMISLSRPNG